MCITNMITFSSEDSSRWTPSSSKPLPVRPLLSLAMHSTQSPTLCPGSNLKVPLGHILSPRPASPSSRGAVCTPVVELAISQASRARLFVRQSMVSRPVVGAFKVVQRKVFDKAVDNCIGGKTLEPDMAQKTAPGPGSI